MKKTKVGTETIFTVFPMTEDDFNDLLATMRIELLTIKKTMKYDQTIGLKRFSKFITNLK